MLHFREIFEGLLKLFERWLHTLPIRKDSDWWMVMHWRANKILIRLENFQGHIKLLYIWHVYKTLLRLSRMNPIIRYVAFMSSSMRYSWVQHFKVAKSSRKKSKTVKILISSEKIFGENLILIEIGPWQWKWNFFLV